MMTDNKYITDTVYNEAKTRTQQKQRVETLGDSRVVKQHHWNTTGILEQKKKKKKKKKKLPGEPRWAEKQT